MKRLTITLNDENYEFLKSKNRPITFTLNDLLDNLRESGAELKTSLIIPTAQMTLEQLQQSGINGDFKIRSPKQVNLTPEEEELKQQKIVLQKDKILKEREKKWFERAREYMKKYWDDDLCHYFAKNHIYGNNIYHDFGPTDPMAIPPEPDDSRLEELLSQYREEAIDDIRIEEERQEREEAWKKIDSMVDNNTGEPDNEYYKKIKAYYSRCEETSALKELLTRLYLEGKVTDEILNYVKDYHMMNIFYALDIPVTHDLTDDEWRELLSNLIISK